MLDIWDMQLASYGREVSQYRRKFIGELNELICPIHQKLSGGKEELIIQYEPNTEADQLEAAVKKSREADRKQKTTLVGPHRDDLSFYVNGIDIRRFGSQGQQRTAALSLKLAEIELVKRSKGVSDPASRRCFVGVRWKTAGSSARQHPPHTDDHYLYGLG